MNTSPAKTCTSFIARLGLAILFALTGVIGQAASASPLAGQRVTLTLTADGTAPFAYKWFKDGVVLAGATASTYVIGSFQTANAGEYSAKVSNSGGVTNSDRANLMLIAPPVITTQPADRTVNVGAAVTLAVVATGSPAPTYEWRKNGAYIGGATGGSYVIASVAGTDAGTYSVVIKNSGGTVTSQGAVLAVGAPPVITTQPAGRTVNVGAAVTLAVVATGSPAPTLAWRKNGAYIAGATGGSYVIASVVGTDAGTYSVVVRNSGGTVTSQGAVLTVNTPPVVTTQPAGRTVNVGAAVTLTVAATGSPAPTLAWRKNGAYIAGATGGTHVIASVAGTDAGTYSVVVRNSVGTVTSYGAVLTVTTPPVITTQPAGRTVIVGAPVTLVVAATGSPAPTFLWRKDGATLPGATGSTHVIASVTPGQAGTYSVVVTNSAGAVTSGNAVLAVNPPLPAHADFNGDGRADILWQNLLTGDHRVWLMNGTALSSTVALGRMTTDWEVVGMTDFNGDGLNDILWQNLVTRDSALWFMAGTMLAGGSSLGVAPVVMRMAGTGDFNADGVPDVLWQNVSTGIYSIRFMDGLTPGASLAIGPGPAGWSIAGTGDFNADGQPDILWENIADGRYARVWLMNGGALLSTTDLAAMPAGWSLGGTGDFNGDGKTDLLWEHIPSGQRKIALMSGLIKASEVSLGVSPPEWIMIN